MVLLMTCFWFSLGSAIRSLRVSLQRHVPYTVFVLVAGLGHGWNGTVCTDDCWTCHPFKGISEKAPVLGMSPLTMQVSHVAVLGAALPQGRLHVCKVFGWVLILDFLGEPSSALMMCTFVVSALPDYSDWGTAMMFGAVLAASDPDPMLASMKETGGNPKLITITIAESIKNP